MENTRIIHLMTLVSSEEVADMKLKLKALDSNVLSVEKAMNDIDIKVCGAHDEEKRIQNELQESCKQTHLVIEKREKDLIKKLRQMTEQKLQNLSVRKEQLQLVNSQLKSCSEAVKESLQIESPTELLRMKHTLTPMIDDITLHLNQVTTHASSKQANNIAFFADKSTIESLKSYGKVYVKLPDGEKCLVQGDGLTRAKVGEVAEVQLSLYDKHNQEIKIGSVAHTISAELYSSAKSSLFKCSIEDFAENKCTVRYEPIMKGAHKLDIEVCGCLVKGSPFCVSVKASLAHIGPDPLLVIPGLSQPWGIVTDNKGRLCVAVSGRKEVVMLNSYSGEKISTVVKRNLLKNTLEEPAGLTLDEDQKLLIADFRLSTIQRVTLSGQVLQEIGSSGYKVVEFTYPSSLAINPINNKIYVTEWKENNRVQILNNDLTHYRTFGCTGSEPGQFLCPSGLAFDRKGNVYVADSNNARIQVFSCDGDYLSDFGKRGQKEGKLGLPMGLCMDLTSDVLYVTDVHNHRVSLFKTDGQFLRCFGSFGSGPGQFNKPQGIAVDEHRFVYVSDTLNDRVQVF